MRVAAAELARRCEPCPSHRRTERVRAWFCERCLSHRGVERLAVRTVPLPPQWERVGEGTASPTLELQRTRAAGAAGTEPVRMKLRTTSQISVVAVEIMPWLRPSSA